MNPVPAVKLTKDASAAAQARINSPAPAGVNDAVVGAPVLLAALPSMSNARTPAGAISKTYSADPATVPPVLPVVTVSAPPVAIASESNQLPKSAPLLRGVPLAVYVLCPSEGVPHDPPDAFTNENTMSEWPTVGVMLTEVPEAY